MEIKFTMHAINRIEERGIMLRDVVVCLNSPDKVDQKGELIYFKKLYKENKRLLICVCSVDTDSCKIVTVIDTSKISKYLNND